MFENEGSQLLTGITVELKAKPVRCRDKWLGESNLHIEASDSTATIISETRGGGHALTSG